MHWICSRQETFCHFVGPVFLPLFKREDQEPKFRVAESRLNFPGYCDSVMEMFPVGKCCHPGLQPLLHLGLIGLDHETCQWRQELLQYWKWMKFGTESSWRQGSSFKPWAVHFTSMVDPDAKNSRSWRRWFRYCFRVKTLFQTSDFIVTSLFAHKTTNQLESPMSLLWSSFIQTSQHGNCM